MCCFLSFSVMSFALKRDVVVVHGSRQRDLLLSSSANTDPNAGRIEGLCVYFSDGLQCLFHRMLND